MPTPFKAKPADESIFDSAPFKLKGTFDIEKPAAEVWAELTGDNPLHWCKILDGIEWTSPRPFGVGTTRMVKSLKGANVFKEVFFRWEDGRRKSFYVTESSAPMFHRFAEDYLVEPRGDSACTFTWIVAMEPKTIAKPGLPIQKRLLGTLFRDTRDHFGLT